MLIVVKSFDHHVFLCLCLRASAQQKLAVYLLYIWDFKRLTANYDWSCSPAGCLLLIPNYTGDRLNFGLAAERAQGEGIRIATYVVGEDCALTTNDKSAGRRGLTGIPVSIKVAFIMVKVTYRAILVNCGGSWINCSCGSWTLVSLLFTSSMCRTAKMGTPLRQYSQLETMSLWLEQASIAFKHRFMDTVCCLCPLRLVRAEQQEGEHLCISTASLMRCHSDRNKPSPLSTGS